jgi:hypothetical protein
MKLSLWILMLHASLLSGIAYAGHEGDPHYTPAGFFDIHVCNWPENPRFLMALFSTQQVDKVAKVSVFAPDGAFVGNIDPTRFRTFKTPSGQAKRAYLDHFDLPEKGVDGWYRAEVVLKDDSRFEARDYVIHQFMAHPTGTRPVPGASDVPVSTELRWDPIPGAQYYEAFVRDDWAGTEAISSGLLTEPRFTPPKGLLYPGGMYVWRIHARDSDGNVLLGDFNHGSLSQEMRFSVK